MLNPYDIPHDCEREGVAAALARLDRRQRRVLRAYVRNVECGDKAVTQWLTEGPDAVAISTWRKPGREGGKYWGTDADPVVPFRKATEMYVKAWLAWEAGEEAKAVRKAGRELRLMAPKAAQRLEYLMENGESHNVQLRAALGVLDRAGTDTAAKGTMAVQGVTADQFAKLAQQAKTQAAEIDAQAAAAWSPDKEAPDDDDD